ncbi:MAG: hypothetical protein FWD63_06955 [Propionibacteriaceae bacterium]|nr:hypothetical protein [Propionibacteriaceae bacterium]
MKRLTGRLPTEIAGAPMRTVRPVMLRGLYANPEKELVRMRDRGTLTKIAHGTYIAKPDSIAAGRPWSPPFEEAAMAYATAAYGDRVPTLMGIGAARHWHAIPRAIAVTVIAVPEPHRPVVLDTGGRVVFAMRRAELVEAIPVQCGLGVMRVTTIEQTLIDLIRFPDLGGMPQEAATAARALRGRADEAKLERLIDAIPKAAAARVRDWLEGEGA